MTDPVRWRDDPNLGAELKEWLAEQSPPTALPSASLANLEAKLASGSGPPGASVEGVASSAAGSASGAGGLFAGKLAFVGSAGALALLGVLGVGALRGEVPASSSDAQREVRELASVPRDGPAEERGFAQDEPPAGLEPSGIEEPRALASEIERSGEASPTLAPKVPEPASAGRPPAPRPATRAARGLGAEAAHLARAQAALASDPEGTLLLLREYETHFPERRLGLEADVLRIYALASAGQGALAQGAARAHLEAHPQSPYVRRIEGLAHSSSVKETGAEDNQ